jgi:hypothetical protein
MRREPPRDAETQDATAAAAPNRNLKGSPELNLPAPAHHGDARTGYNSRLERKSRYRDEMRPIHATQ